MAMQANGRTKQPNGQMTCSSTTRRPVRANGKGLFSRMTTLLIRLSIWYTAFIVLFRCPSSHSDLTESSSALCEPYLNLRAVAIPQIQPYYDVYLAPYAEKAQPYVDRVKTQVYAPAVAFATTHGAPRLAQAQEYGHKEWERSVRPQLHLAKDQILKQYDASLAPHVQKVTSRVEPYYTTVKTSALDLYELELQPAYKHTAPHARKAYLQARLFARDTVLPYSQWSAELAWTFLKRQVWPKLQVLYGENVEPQIFRITQRLGRYRDEKKIEAAANSVETDMTSAQSSLSSVAATPSAASTAATSFVESILSKASSVIAPSPSIAPVDEEGSAAENFAADLKSWEDQVAKAVHEGTDHLRERIQEICDRQLDKQIGTVGGALIVRLDDTSNSAFRTLKDKVQTIINTLPNDPTDEDIALAQDIIAKETRKAGQTIKERAQSVRDWKQTYEKETTDLVEAAANSTLETIDNIRDLRLQDIGRRWASNEAITHKDWSRYNELKKASSRWRDDVETVAVKHARLADARKGATDIEEQAMALAEEAAKELARLKDVALWKLQAKDASDDFNTRYVPPVAERVKQQVLDLASDASDAVVGTFQGSAESATSVASSKAAESASTASEAVLGSETGSIESVASKMSEQVIGTEQPTPESVVSAATQSVKGAASVVSENVENTVSSASHSIVGSESGMGEQAATKISEAVVGTETPTIQSLSSSAVSLIPDIPIANSRTLGPKAASLLSAAKAKGTKASSSIGDALPSPGSVLSDASSSIVSAASSISHAVPEPVSVVSEVSSSGASAASYISNAVPNSQSMSSQASSSFSSVSTEASNPIQNVNPAKPEASSSAASVVSQVSDAIPDAPSPASVAEKDSKKVFGGVMAQAAPSVRSIVLDDDIIDTEGSYSAKMQSVMNNLGDQASRLTQAVQDAIKPATTTQGSVESVTSLASEQYASALAAASSVLFGTEQGTGASMASVAGDRYAEAVTAASIAIFGSLSSATGILSSATGSISSATGSLTRAGDFLSFATESLSSVATPVASSVTGSLSSATGSISSATGSLTRAGDFLSFATESLSSVATPVASSVTGSLSSATVSLSSAAASVASSVTAYPSSVVESLDSATGPLSSSATSVASSVAEVPASSGNAFTDQASSSYNEALSVASYHYSSVKSLASVQVSGTGVPVHEKMLSSVGSAYSDSVSAASENIQAALSYTSALSIPAMPGRGALESISAIASSRLADGLSAASAQYSSAKAAAATAPSAIQEQYLADAQRKYYEGIGYAYDRYSAFETAAREMVSTKTYAQPSSAYQNMLSAAQSQYSSASVIASGNLENILSSAKLLGSETTHSHAQSILSKASDRYDASLSAASASLASASTKASDAVYGTPTPAYESLLSAAQSQYDYAYTVASSNLQEILASGSSVVGDIPAQSIIDSASSQYEAAVAAAAGAYSTASNKASDAIYGTSTGSFESVASAMSTAAFGSETAWTASVASQASENWEALVSRASEQVYGTPAPTSGYLASQAGDYASQASQVAVGQYAVVAGLFAELLSGREPDFTESVMNRFQSAYSTGAPVMASSASSVAANVYSSASSVASSVFTPPAALEAIIDNAAQKLNAAVDAASGQIYGTSKGNYEQATEAAGSAYNSAASQVSGAIYGTQTGYVESAQSQMSDAIASAQQALSQAVYGTPTGTFESATDAAASSYASVSSLAASGVGAAGSRVADHYDSLTSAMSSAVLGPESGAFESAQGRLNAAIESAKSRMAQFGDGASRVADDAVSKVKDSVQDAASSVSSAATSVASMIRDEL